jgi:HK97 family phage prohead protease
MFNRPSVPLPFIEQIAPGAFRSTLARVKAGEADILALTEHSTNNLLGRMSAGNLTLVEDAVGLRFTLELPDTQLGRDVRELVGRGILRGMSFSFSVTKDSWTKGDDGRSRRTVHDLTLFEVSVVSTPAYPSTSVSATRSLRSTTSDAFWTAARLRAVSARPTRGAAAVATARSTPTREWR